VQLAGYEVGERQPLFLIAGPCSIESEEMALHVATTLARTCARLGIPYVFKGSFDKANRSSNQAPRGLGIAEGLRILALVKREVGVPVLTDVHENTPIDEVASVVDVLQTPAFLVRQTDFIKRVASAGRPVNIKKGQFLAPWDMQLVVEKCHSVGNREIMVCERGVSFGYNTLVADMRSLAILRQTGCPVVFDATHSTQQRPGEGTVPGDQREMIPVLARSAVAAGVAGLFMEIHPDPLNAWSDATSQWPLARAEELLSTLVEIDRVVKKQPWAEAPK